MKGIGVLILVLVLGLAALFLFTDNYQQQQIDQLSETQVELKVGVEHLDQEVKRIDTEVVTVRNSLAGVQTELGDLEDKMKNETAQSEQQQEAITAELEKLKGTLEKSAQDQQALKNHISSLEETLKLAQQERIEMVTQHLELKRELQDLAQTQSLLKQALERIEPPPIDPRK